MNDKIKELTEALKKVNELMTEENLKKASTEQLLAYNEQINKIKSIIITKLS